MLEFLDSRSKSRSHFDVFAAYSESLAIARQARGEPTGEWKRALWKAKLWLQSNRNTLSRLGVGFVAFAAGYLLGGSFGRNAAAIKPAAKRAA